jgi:hypothetical protein
MACISLELTAKGFKKCFTSNTVDGNDNDMLWNVRRMGMLRVSVRRRMNAMTVKMDTVMLISKYI